MHETASNMIHGFNFDMWVSSPQQSNRIDKALHVYTRLQGDQHHLTAPPMPLENLVGWRNSFPHLASLIEEGNGPLDCDIILLEANLELMTDFPPSGSRLGIQLELDFAHPTAGDLFMVSQLEDWTCGTHIYEGGQEMLETYHELQKTSSTKVKPLFESPWWAKLFTQLTQEKRMAEDSGQYHAADEHARQFFRSLSAVQELRATPHNSRRMSSQYPGGDQSKRMAMLLWKFRQTRPGEVGTTTWRRLIPPPDRATTNSPRPAVDLPPLSLDSIMMNKPHQNLYQLPQPQDLPYTSTSQSQQWPMYPTPQDGAGMWNQNGAFDFLNSITRDDGYPEKPAVTSVLDTYSNLRPETSQPTQLNGGSVMMNMPDLSSLSHPSLPSYNDNHYVPSPQQQPHPQPHAHAQDTSHHNVLSSIFGAANTNSIDEISHSHASWAAAAAAVAPPPTTTIPEDSYSHLHFHPSEHHVSANRESHHPSGLDGLIPPDDLMDKIVGSMPGDMHAGGTGPDHDNSYADEPGAQPD